MPGCERCSNHWSVSVLNLVDVLVFVPLVTAREKDLDLISKRRVGPNGFVINGMVRHQWCVFEDLGLGVSLRLLLGLLAVLSSAVIVDGTLIDYFQRIWPSSAATDARARRAFLNLRG